MAKGMLGRVALVVDDIDAVAHDFERFFEMDLRLSSADEMKVRAAVGNEGVELVQPMAPDPPAGPYWQGPLAALCVRVDDLEAIAARIEGAGFVRTQTFEMPRMKEYFYGDFHGFPLVIYAHDGDGFADDAGGEMTITWHEGPLANKETA
jgi:hypothetical protein